MRILCRRQRDPRLHNICIRLSEFGAKRHETVTSRVHLHARESQR